jgi:pimeloyl-ACP methyl ester carboxylesterase
MGLPDAAPPPDPRAEPEGYVVILDVDRIHFLDWGGPPDARTAALLLHGLGGTSWAWTPVARRLRSRARTVALDLRGHGLSDSPPTGYDPAQLVDDAVAAAEGSGLLPIAGSAIPATGPGPSAPPRLVLAGHGLGGMVAAWTAARLGAHCGGVVLVDGGWEDLRETSGMEPEEWLRGLDEPPEVLRSMAAFLADRAGFDPASWDADQERAARETVAEVPAGHLLPAVRPHVRAALVEAMFAYAPAEILPAIEAPIVALVARDDEAGTRRRALEEAQAVLARANRPPIRVRSFPDAGHNLMRYRPAEVTRAILSLP